MEIAKNEKISKVEILNELTVAVTNEGHTLINLLKTMISNNWSDEEDNDGYHNDGSDGYYNDNNIDSKNKVEFCGYNVPHPSDPVVHFTIQFENEQEQEPKKVLKKMKEGLVLIEKCCRNLQEQVDHWE